MLVRLRDMLAWMQEQRQFRFYGSSLLFMYEGVPELPPLPTVHMIDFGHAVSAADGKADEGYIFGLKAVIAEFEKLAKPTKTG